MSLVFPGSSESYQFYAALFSVIDSQTRQRSKLCLNSEQLELARLILDQGARYLLVLKSRQIGTSTFFALLDFTLAILNPGIKVAIVADTQAKAQELLERIKSFGEQIGISWEVANTRKLRLPNGSEIHGLTAGSSTGGEESRAGRSLSFDVLHLTELPYWQSSAAYSSLLASAPNAPVFIETTAKGSGDLLSELWEGENKYLKVFFSVEQHESYTASEDSCTEAEWQEAQELGFQSRKHAAWWLSQLKLAGGDLIKHLHDYPVTPDHCFSIHEDRWIRAIPAVLASHKVDSDVELFQPAEPYHRYVCAVDTSGGVGKDCNAVVLLDRSTRALVASWSNADATIDTVVSKCRILQSMYPVDAFIIETNGIGRATYQRAASLSLPVLERNTTEANKYSGLLAVKRAVEAGTIAGPERLRDEANSLHVKDGKFRGKKDLCMALSFALEYIEVNPYAVVMPVPANVYDPSKFLRTNNGGWGLS